MRIQYNTLFLPKITKHYNDVIMSSMVSQITSLMIVYSTAYSRTDQRKHQSSASLAFVRGFHRWPMNSPHKGPATRKMFPFDDVIMQIDASAVLLNNNTEYLTATKSELVLFFAASWCNYIEQTAWRVKHFADSSVSRATYRGFFIHRNQLSYTKWISRDPL